MSGPLNREPETQDTRWEPETHDARWGYEGMVGLGSSALAIVLAGVTISVGRRLKQFPCPQGYVQFIDFRIVVIDVSIFLLSINILVLVATCFKRYSLLLAVAGCVLAVITIAVLGVALDIAHGGVSSCWTF